MDLSLPGARLGMKALHGDKSELTLLNYFLRIYVPKCFFFSESLDVTDV